MNSNADGQETIKFNDKSLFIEWKEWCLRNNIKIELNNIQFGLKLSLLMKQNINKEAECIKKDTHNNTIINAKEMKSYFRKLNGITQFIEED